MAFPKRVPLSTDRKVKTLKALRTVVGRLRQQGKKIILTTGVFDYLHLGHLDYLEKAKKLGGRNAILVVAIVDDRFVRKGPARPIFNERFRAGFLAALAIVDYVVLDGDFGPATVMRTIKPDFYAKGATREFIRIFPKILKARRGRRLDFWTMEKLGGKIVLIPEIMHSSDIFKKIKAAG